MNLDAYDDFQQIDAGNMYAHIEGLPEQFSLAWALGEKLPLPSKKGVIRSIIVAGMGGSAIGGDLVSAYIAPYCRAPVIVHRDYGLPAWAHGPETLVIASSHSGNTEETLSAFDQAHQNNCRIVAITRGGKLAELGDMAATPVWRFKHEGMPRAAVGFSFSLLLALISRLGLVPELDPDIHATVRLLHEQREILKKETPLSANPAKALAEKLAGRFVSIVGSDYLAPVARRWKGQINELAKANANFEYLPEMDHNTLAGVNFPPDLLRSWMVVFLQAASDHPRNRLRSESTLLGLRKLGIGADQVMARGTSPLDHLWSMIQIVYYVAYYLAMQYGIDPTPIAAIEDLKQAMKGD